MPEPYILKINDIFWSFQGEGLRIGFPSIFIRLCGCTLGCDYCDSKEAWREGQNYTIDQILSQIERFQKQYPMSQIVITGGEPFEQDLSLLVSECKNRDFFIAVETTGSQYQDLNFDWITLSPKDVNSFNIQPGFIGKQNEIKLIVNDNLNLDVIQKLRGLGLGFPIFLQPNCFDPERYDKTWQLFCDCQKKGIPDIRVGYQMHKIFKVK